MSREKEKAKAGEDYCDRERGLMAIDKIFKLEFAKNDKSYKKCQTNIAGKTTT